MSSRNQQVTSIINSSNNIVNFSAHTDAEGIKICSGYLHLNHNNATKVCELTDLVA